MQGEGETMEHRLSVIVRAAAASALVVLAACSQSLETIQGPAILVTGGSSERYSGQLVVADDMVVYVSYQTSNAENASVRRVPTSGGKEATIAANEGDIEELTTDGTNAYWLLRAPTTFDRTIRSAPILGGAATTLATGIAGTVDVSDKCFATDGAFVYFSSLGHGIRRVAVTGGPITDLAPTAVAESCSLSDGFVYYKDQSTFYRVPAAGGTVQALASGVSPDPGVEILTIGNTVFGLDVTVLYAFPTTGGDIVPVALGLGDARDLAGNAAFMYFNNIDTENLVRVALSDDFISPLYTGISVGLALDNTYVYWVASGFQVMRGVQ